MAPLSNLFILALVTASMTLVIAKSYVFLWLRQWLAKKAEENDRVWYWLHELAICHFCLSFWVAWGLQIVYQQRFIIGAWSDLIVSWLAIVGLATLFSSLIIYLNRQAQV